MLDARRVPDCINLHLLECRDITFVCGYHFRRKFPVPTMAMPEVSYMALHGMAGKMLRLLGVRLTASTTCSTRGEC